MERELWNWIMRAIHDVGRSRRDSAYHTHSTALIVRVYLWAVLKDRPTSWACDPRHWDDRTRPQTLPSQSTMSRRLRTEHVQAMLEQIGRRLAGRCRPTLTLLKLIDGKPLVVAPHSKDPDARWGRGASQPAKGYKLHLVFSGKPMPDAFAVTPLDAAESGVARRLIPTLEGQGYLVADAGYDDDRLYRSAADRGHRFLAPRRRPHTGLARKPFHPDRLAAVALLEAGPRMGQTFGRHLLRLRGLIETSFGNLTGFYAGLTHLPPWVRRLNRVKLYVHAKLIINAARIRANRA